MLLISALVVDGLLEVHLEGYNEMLWLLPLVFDDAFSSRSSLVTRVCTVFINTFKDITFFLGLFRLVAYVMVSFFFVLSLSFGEHPAYHFFLEKKAVRHVFGSHILKFSHLNHFLKFNHPPCLVCWTKRDKRPCSPF